VIAPVEIAMERVEIERHDVAATNRDVEDRRSADSPSSAQA
jgi:hypothetical protein